MQNHLVLFTFGPVQGFIAEARTTQDLYAGSRMLAEVTRRGYHSLVAKLPPNTWHLIFPSFTATNGHENVTSNPNRFLIRVTDISCNTLTTWCKEAEAELRQGFIDDALELLQKKPFKPHKAVLEKARRQLEGHLQVYWAILPFDPKSYTEQYTRLESYLGGIKNLRAFDQLGNQGQGERGRKCNVDGRLNALFVRHAVVRDGLTFQKKPPPFVVDASSPKEEQYCRIPNTDYRFDPGEGLSAMSTYKRVYERDTFKSTAGICLLHVTESTEDAEARKLFEEYKAMFARHFDEQLLFPENLSLPYFRRNSILLNDDGQTQSIPSHIIEAYQRLAAHPAVRLGPSYYAVLLFDGDRMGEWMSGKYLADKQKELLAFQEHMRDLLLAFSEACEAHLTGPRGRSIYAGGDDFLGMVNLYHLLEVIRWMRLQFDDLVSKPLRQEGQGYTLIGEAPMFSFSAGVAIAHYKEPLKEVLAEARRAEQQAKTKGPNACCFSIIRHAGGKTHAVLPFGEDLTTSLDALDHMVDVLSRGHFSNAFIHQLIRESRSLHDFPSPDAFRTEGIRLIRRSCNLRNEEAEAAVQEMQSHFEHIVDHSMALDVLRFADFLSRNTKTTQQTDALPSA